MIFTESLFFLFFAIAFAVHWLLPRNSLRKIWLLIGSYVFYAAWDWRFLSLIWISTIVDFMAGRMLGRQKAPLGRRFWLVASLVCNLGLLGVFKYYHFFIDPAAALLEWLGIPTSISSLQVILPVGISFYTFQTLSYTIDVYRRKLEPIGNPLDFALFVGFFPQLVAGPIVRAIQFLPQLKDKKKLVDVAFRANLILFLIGYIKKACVADHIAAFIDPIYADPTLFGMHAQWQALLLYAIQIYCDFSGYSDMAIATAGFFGFRLPLNFDFPLLATSVTEFWKRWHLTLSTWFRDYLYFPLGGNKRGTARTYFNLLLVFMLCGMWHGGSWLFAIWGLFHGVFLIFERLTGMGRTSAIGKPWRHLYFWFVISLTWPLFRGETFAKGMQMYQGMFGFGPATSQFVMIDLVWWVTFAGFMVVHAAMYRKFLHSYINGLSDWKYSLIYGAGAALALLFSAADYQPFIYFQF